MCDSIKPRVNDQFDMIGVGGTDFFGKCPRGLCYLYVRARASRLSTAERYTIRATVVYDQILPEQQFFDPLYAPFIPGPRRTNSYLLMPVLFNLDKEGKLDPPPFKDYGHYTVKVDCICQYPNKPSKSIRLGKVGFWLHKPNDPKPVIESVGYSVSTAMTTTTAVSPAIVRIGPKD